MTDYVFKGGYPEPGTIERARDDLDLNRAIQAYRFFYPSVSGLAMFKGNEPVGLVANRVFGLLDTRPEQVGYTLNSDTPYGPIMLDLRRGPMVVKIPQGPLLCAALDLNQRWVADMGIPGPDAGEGGEHLLLPPGWDGEVPDGCHVWRATTYRVLVGVRAIPIEGDVEAAIARIRTVEVRPLESPDDWTQPTWKNFSGDRQDTTPLRSETSLDYWRALHEVVDTEPAIAEWTPMYGELAALGIVKGRAFTPDERMTRILETAALLGNGQLRVQAFAGDRRDSVVWADRQWRWPALRPENGSFDGLGYLDEEAREIWFFQAIAASPAMFRRQPGSGSLYWLGLRDRGGAYLDGGRSYRLVVPQPVPARLFWSVTVYDAETRSQIATARNRAALRSLFELSDAAADEPIELWFGPEPPRGPEDRWIETIPGKGWFVYFRIYGPEEGAFDGSWRLPDFEVH